MASHTINSLGTISGRCSSFAPNLQQVPAVRAEFGAECRELFTIPEGYQLVGVDLSGIELRCLAHFMQDGGAYAKEILDGDIHSANAAAMGVSRDEAKTAIYCMIYGGGDKRSGEAVNGSAKKARHYARGSTRTIQPLKHCCELLVKLCASANTSQD